MTGDIVVMFDADGSADPAEIARFVEALKNGADFAKGSRFTAGGGSADITPDPQHGQPVPQRASSTSASGPATPTSATATTRSGPT